MRRAIWLWDEANCEEALGENELEGEIPKCTGKQCLALQKRTRHPFFPILDVREPSSLSWWEFFKVKVLPETACTFYIFSIAFLNVAS